MLDRLFQVIHRPIIALVREGQPLHQATERHLCPLHDHALGLCHHRDIFRKLVPCHDCLPVQQLPGGGNDVLLGFHKRAGSPPLPGLATPSGLLRRPTEFFFGGNHLQKIDVGHALRIIEGPLIIHCLNIVGDKITWSHVQILKIDDRLPIYSHGSP